MQSIFALVKRIFYVGKSDFPKEVRLPNIRVLFFAFLLLATCSSLLASTPAAAFDGPQYPAGQGTGSFSYTGGRFGVGTSTPFSDARFVIVASSSAGFTNAGSWYAMKVVNPDCGATQMTCPSVFSIRNDGSVVMGGGYYGVPSGGGGYDQPPTGSTYNRGLTVWGPTFVNGSLNAMEFLGGNIQPTLVRSGVFNDKGFNGTFAFRGWLAIATTTVDSIPQPLSVYTNATGTTSAYFSGGVGIGTPSPISRLHVQGLGATIQDQGIAEFTDGSRNGVSIGYDTTTNRGWIYARSPGTSVRMLSLNDSVFIGPTSGSLGNGNVGIGTTNPGTKLEISTPTGAATIAHIYSPGTNDATDDAVLGFTTQASRIYSLGIRRDTGNFTISNADRSVRSGALVTINNSGNVGINTTQPSSTLHVIGNVKISGSVTAGSLTGTMDAALINTGAFGSSATKGNYEFQHATSTVSVMYIDSTNDRVGIGTTGPRTKLEVHAATEANLLFREGSAFGPANGGGIQSYNDANTDYLPLTFAGSSYFFYTGSNSGQGRVGIGTTSPTGHLSITQTAAALGALKGIVYTGAVNTNQTLSTEIPSLTLTTAGRQWAAGNITIQREVLITQPTYSFVTLPGNSTITDAATIGIAGAPIASTNATLTNSHGLLIQAGAVGAGTTNSYGLTVNAQTGATTGNYAAAFLGGNVGIGTTGPGAKLHVIGSELRLTDNNAMHSFYGADNARNGYIQFVNSDAVYILNEENTPMRFYTNNLERLTILAGGNVGINTTQPSSTLHVIGNVKISGSVTAGSLTGTMDAALINTGAFGSSATKGNYEFQHATSTVSVMYIDSTNDRVGIGTTGPTAKLQITGTVITDNGMNTVSSNGAGNGYQYGLALRRSDGTFGSPTAVVNGDALGTFQWQAYNNGGYQDAAYIGALLDGAPGITYSPTAITFNTASASADWSEKMRITSGGNVGIGTTSPVGGRLVVDENGAAVRLRRADAVRYRSDFSVTSGGLNINAYDDTGGVYLPIEINASTFKVLTGAGNQQGLFQNTTGNVGIGTTAPTTAGLVVTKAVSGASIDAGSQRIINVVGPVNPTDAATKQTVIDALSSGSTPVTSSTSGFVLKTGDVMSGNLNMGGQNIVGVNKINVTTIDPLYEIGGVKYATFGPNSIGQISQVYGKLNLRKSDFLREESPTSQILSAAFDFAHTERGSDLWLFWQTIAEGKDMKDITVNLTPEFDGRVWYELRPPAKQIVVFAESSVATRYSLPATYSVSYHLSAPRHDAASWPNAVPNEQEQGIPLQEK